MESVGKLSVIVLTRNEEKSIAQLIEEIADKVAEPFEILVVDASVDRTASIVRKASSLQANLRLVPQEGSGYTSAITTAIKYSQGDALVVVVGDLGDEIADINKMRDKMAEGYDIVCASRYMPGGARQRGSLVQSVFSYLVCKSLKALLGIQTSDISNSFKMYKKRILRRIELKDSGFATSMQITLKAFFNGDSIAEIPTVWRNRAAGASKFYITRQIKHYVYWYFWALATSIGVRMQSWRHGI